jgi:hypothetical protein
MAAIDLVAANQVLPGHIALGELPNCLLGLVAGIGVVLVEPAIEALATGVVGVGRLDKPTGSRADFPFRMAIVREPDLFLVERGYWVLRLIQVPINITRSATK